MPLLCEVYFALVLAQSLHLLYLSSSAFTRFRAESVFKCVAGFLMAEAMSCLLIGLSYALQPIC